MSLVFFVSPFASLTLFLFGGTGRWWWSMMIMVMVVIDDDFLSLSLFFGAFRTLAFFGVQMADLQVTIQRTLQTKKDTSYIRPTAPLLPLRTPPVAIRCRRILKGHFGKVTSLVRVINNRRRLVASSCFVCFWCCFW